MINLFPQKSKTLVSALSQEGVVLRISMLASIQPDAPQLYRPLMGWIKEDHFRVALRARRPNAFSPVATGRIESTSNGCLIFLDFRLTPSTQFYLGFWSIIALLSGIITAVHFKNLSLCLASFGILAFINGTAWANFHLHVKALHNTLLKAMEQTI